MVGDVHADLGAVVGEHAESLDAMQAAVGSADIAGDGASRGDVGLAQVNVVGDQEAAGADYRGSCGRVQLRAADIGPASGFSPNGITKSFELATAHILQLDAIGPGGGGSVKVNRDPVTAPEIESCLAGKQGAVCQRCSLARE